MDSTKLADVFGGPLLSPWPYHERFVPTSRDWHYHRGPEQGSESLLVEYIYQNPGKTPADVDNP